MSPRVRKPAIGVGAGGCWAIVGRKVPDGRRDWSWANSSDTCGNSPRHGCLTCSKHKHLEEEAQAIKEKP